MTLKTRINLTHQLSLQRKFSTSQLRPAIKLKFDQYGGSENSSKRDHRTDRQILILHGLFGSKRNYRSISKVLARELDLPVFALDLRNHGDSPHSPEHDYMALASDVKSFIRQHMLSRPTIIGHSMGAKVAMTLSLNSPKLVDSLISVDNAPASSPLSDSFTKYITAMEEVDTAKVTTQKKADEIIRQYESSPQIRQFLLTNLKQVPGENYLKFSIPLQYLSSALDNIAKFPYMYTDEVRYEKPALFLKGNKSRYISDDTIPAINRFFPKNRLQSIDAGHWIISEKPGEFIKAVVDFMLC